jgi:hypothetical protein
MCIRIAMKRVGGNFRFRLTSFIIALLLVATIGYSLLFRDNTIRIEFVHDGDGAGYDWTGFEYFFARRTGEHAFELVDRYCYRHTTDFLERPYVTKYRHKYQSVVPGRSDEFVHIPRTPYNSPMFFTDLIGLDNSKLALFYSNSRKNMRLTGDPQSPIVLDSWSCLEFSPQRHNVISTKMLFENANATLGKYAGCKAE